MLHRWFKQIYLLYFVFLTACQTIETTNFRHFKGSLNVEQNHKKQSRPVEIYTDSSQPVLQVNFLTPFGGVFASYLWKDQKHQIILPARKQYFQESRWPPDFPLQGVLQNPLWLYKALSKQFPEDWNCEKTHQKCETDNFAMEWEKKIFQREKINIRLKKENLSLNLSPYKSSSNTPLSVKIPEGFTQINNLDSIR